MKIDLFGDSIGSVEYISHMGSDLSVVNAARVSFGWTFMISCSFTCSANSTTPCVYTKISQQRFGFLNRQTNNSTRTALNSLHKYTAYALSAVAACFVAGLACLPIGGGFLLRYCPKPNIAGHYLRFCFLLSGDGQSSQHPMRAPRQRQ